MSLSYAMGDKLRMDGVRFIRLLISTKPEYAKLRI
jgi:hypothetical protein